MITESGISIRDLEQYRVKNDLAYREIASRIGISINVYIVNVIGRKVRGKTLITNPTARNRYKFDRFIADHESEIRAALDQRKTA